ncbi:PREDICTED: centrosomal protein of 162 kDa-like [Branchiostoma belcheri]|uniref:Centrosomal protein of 162 kDa n=1 Tax=Branchiostoma belcheri TaxID=7741 RepID=A0A6P5A9W1_BRABE|nr:PREDICTED: centrosomal protein of 162 kDa-like [Branchiostoma belcheri]XP_019638557.1 PREDICTED: centrosomal protein of 162 kDa-like [Branchiostoma belcheri]
MSGKMSKKELDHQFEQFLKESLSDDSLDDGGGKAGSVLHRLGQREPKKEPKLWWMEEDDEGSPRLKSSSTNRWLTKKDKKKEEPSGKELGGSQEAKFLKSLNRKSPTEPPTSGLAANFDNPPARRDVEVSKDSLEDFFHIGRSKGNNGGRGGVIPEKASFEDTLIESSDDEAVDDVRAGSAPGTGPGMDTLEELAEKERFFKEIEGSAEGTVDYGRLNEEADLTDTLKRPTSGHKVENNESKLDSYSEDFSDESQDKDEDRDESEKVTGKTSDAESSKKLTSTPPSKPMLARVALFDTMDSSFGTGKLGKTLLPSGGDTDGDSPQIKMVPTATGTNSDVEALQRALQDAQMSTLGTGTAADLDLGGGTEARGFNLSPAQPRGRGFDLEPAGTEDGGFTLPEENRGFDLQPADDSRRLDLHPTGEKHGFDLQPAGENHGFDLRPAGENHGFDLQPADSAGGFDLSQGQTSGPDVHGFDLSPAHVDPKGFHYNDQDLDKTVESKPQTPVPTPRKHIGQKFTFESPERQHRTIQDLERDIETQVGRLDRLVDDSMVDGRTEQVGKKGKAKKGKQQQVRSSGYGKVIPSKRTNGSASTPDAKLGKHARNSPLPKTSTPSKQGKTVSFHGQGAKGRPSSASPYRWTPKQVSTFKARGVPMDDSVAGSQLMASVESFAHYIQDHFSPERKGKSSRQAWEDKPPVKSDGPPPGVEHLSREKMLLLQVQDLQKELEVEQKLREKIHADFRAQQREYQREMEELRLQHDKELDQLRQENFVLRAKLGDSEAHGGDEKDSEPSSQKSDSKFKGKAADEEVERLRQEVKVQEDLLKGYQQENERLYAQLKTGTSKYKETETLLFQENQRLQADVARLKEEGEQRERALLFKGVITSPAAQQQIKAGTAEVSMATARVAYLEKELKKSKLHSEDLLRDVVRLKGEKSHLEQQLDRERALGVQANRQVSEVSAVQQLEVRTRVQQYEEEVLELRRKLRWYAENQELVDRQTRVLREKEEEMERLRSQVKRLEVQTGQKQDSARGRAKERAADAKRILDLERQVKEMENIIKRRHPNSIPAMILAANAAPQPAPGSPTRPLSVQFLENRIRKLEGELERRDEDAKLSLRALQQTHNQVKLQYEEEISRLRDQLADRGQMSARVDSNKVSALEMQLDLERTDHNKMVEEFKREITELHKRLEAAQMRRSMTDKQAFAAEKFEAETLVLKKELKEKSQEIFQLQKTCQKLQAGSGKDGGKFGKTKIVGKKKMSGKDVASSPRHDVAFPDSLDDRSYEPHAFSGLHISDIQRENETLKQQVENLSFELEQQRVKSQMQVAEAESSVRKAQEASEERLDIMKAAHQREVEKLLSQYTRQQSTSEVAELTSRLQTRDVMLEHLKSELASAKRDQEELVRVKLREEALQRQLSRLQEELAEAKAQQSPEMRHFESLQSKIQAMEDKYRERERGLQNGVLSPKGGRSDSQWAQIVESKNRQIEQFRAELDSILAVLRQIQQNKMSAGYRIPTI